MNMTFHGLLPDFLNLEYLALVMSLQNILLWPCKVARFRAETKF